jgi:hypothetical protein
VLGAAIGVAAVLSISLVPEKCPAKYRLTGTAPGEPAVVIDGEIAPGLEAIDPQAAHSIEVTCWDPESNEIHAKEGVSFVHVVTKARVDDAVAALGSFAAAYAAFNAESSVRPETVEQLVPFGLAAPQRFDYSTGELGVSVSVSDSRHVYRCTSALDQIGGTHACYVDFTGARRSLLAAWERADEGD